MKDVASFCGCILVMSVCGCLFHSTNQRGVPEFQNLLISVVRVGQITPELEAPRVARIGLLVDAVLSVVGRTP